MCTRQIIHDENTQTHTRTATRIDVAFGASFHANGFSFLAEDKKEKRI